MHIGISLFVDAFCFGRSFFWGETNDRTSKEGQRSVNAILSITSIAMGLCTNFFSFFAFSIVLWLGLAYGSGFFLIYFVFFVRFKEWHGAAQHGKLVDTFHFRFSLIVVSECLAYLVVVSESNEIATL